MKATEKILADLKSNYELESSAAKQELKKVSDELESLWQTSPADRKEGDNERIGELMDLRNMLANQSMVIYDDYVRESNKYINEIHPDMFKGLLEDYTYDIHFNDDSNSNSKGFKETFEYCINYIKEHNGSNDSYFNDYKGGVVSILCIETGKTEFETEVL